MTVSLSTNDPFTAFVIFPPGFAFSSDSSASSNAVFCLLFFSYWSACNSSKYFTIKMCPFWAAKCRGLFRRSCVTALISAPSLIKMRTMSRSPSLAAFQMMRNPSFVGGFLQMLNAVLFWLLSASLSLGSVSAENASNWWQMSGWPL